MMKPAVRVVNALPVVLKNAAVAAFAVAASAGGHDDAFETLAESADAANGGRSAVHQASERNRARLPSRSVTTMCYRVVPVRWPLKQLVAGSSVRRLG